MVFTRPSVDEIFNEAIRQSPGNDRAAYLDEVCGDNTELKGRVERLLRAFADAGSFLESPASDMGSTTEAPTIAERPGTVIGPYKLLQQIGEGGFGVVFLAEQERPVKRRVALKVIKPGMDTRQVIARFEAERQALAMMDHPNIAKVLDAGTTGAESREQRAGSMDEVLFPAPRSSLLAPSTGRPYFVMELVQGVPITEYCDQCHLTTRERLELFVTVCQAVQHAHQKGIIHRDIKPTNVLVAIQDGRPSPKIIDFGVAKAINQQLTEHTLMTAFAQMVGTPLYMSPEQAELSPLGVDTRSDIYSLGVLLYELLAGTTPFDKDRLHAASYDELRRIIREEEPPRPSARISTLDAQQAITIADHRRTDARRLRQTVRGELDWIVMKCLEKDRNRRYETPNSLARDIERYLNDEPVQACPPSASYRFRKFARRNKTLLAAGGAIAATLVIGLGLTTWQYFRAATESARAKAVSDLLQEMLGSADATRAKGSQYTVRELLDDFSTGLGNQLADEPAVEADIRVTIGRAYRSLALSELAQPHLERAMELRRRVDGPDNENLAAILVENAVNLRDQGRSLEAQSQLREALEIYRQRDITGGPVMYALRILQYVLITFGHYDEAERVTQEALAIANRSGEETPDRASILALYAEMKCRQGHFAEGEQIARQAVDMNRRLYGDQHLETASALSPLVFALQSQHKLAEAEAAMREHLAILRSCYGPEHANVRRGVDRLQTLLQQRGNHAAIDELEREEADQATRSDSPDHDVRLAGLLLTNQRADETRKIEEAHRLLQRAIERYARVAIDFPKELDRRLKAVDGYMDIAKTCADHPDFAQEVDEAHRRLMAELAGLLVSFPDSDRCREEVGRRYRSRALSLQQNGNDLSQVEQAHREAIKLFEKLSISLPKLPGIWFHLANCYAHLGEVRWRTARPEGAETAFGRAMELYEQHAAEITVDPLPYVTSEVTRDYVRIAYYLATTRREQQAAEFVRKATLNAKRLTDPTDSANGLYYVALIQARLGDQAGYRESCKSLVDLPLGSADYLTNSRPIWTPCLAPDALDDLGMLVRRAEEFVADKSLNEQYFGLYLLGAAHYRTRQYEQAAQRLQESIDTYASSPMPGYDTKSYQQLLLAMTKWQLGEQDESRRLLAETLPAVEQELQSPSSGWNRRATLEILRREAEELIEERETKEAVANKEAPVVSTTDN